MATVYYTFFVLIFCVCSAYAYNGYQTDRHYLAGFAAASAGYAMFAMVYGVIADALNDKARLTDDDE